MRYLILLITIFIFTGCSTKSVSYTLPVNNYQSIATKRVQIGVKRVEVPSYLKSDKILIKDGIKIEEIDSTFIAPPDELLTGNTIKLLKSSLNNPNVLLYPWDVKSKKGYIVEIKLDKFMYDTQNAVVEGSYYIKSSSGAVLVSKNFSKSQPTTKDADSIVTTLSSLFDSVVIEIARKIAK